MPCEKSLMKNKSINFFYTLIDKTEIILVFFIELTVFAYVFAYESFINIIF